MKPTGEIASADCPFCHIVADPASVHSVVESPAAVAFLDHRPLFPGHCLVVPRDHVVTLGELPPAALEPLFRMVQRVARALEDAMEAQGTFVAVNNRVSQSVPHLHVHVVPRRFKDGLRGFFWPRQKYATAAAMDETAERIRACMPPD